MKVLGLVVLLIVSTVSAIYFFQNKEHSGKSRPEAYKIMDILEAEGIYGRNFKFVDIEGQPVAVNDYKGKIIIFSFWATWCEPCVEEFPSLVKLIDTYPEKVVLFAISHDEDKADVRNFIKAFDGQRPGIKVVFDQGKSVSKALEVDRLPEGYIFNGKGQLVKKILGIQDWATKGALEYFDVLN